MGVRRPLAGRSEGRRERSADAVSGGAEEGVGGGQRRTRSVQQPLVAAGARHARQEHLRRRHGRLGGRQRQIEHVVVVVVDRRSTAEDRPDSPARSVRLQEAGVNRAASCAGEKTASQTRRGAGITLLQLGLANSAFHPFGVDK